MSFPFIWHANSGNSSERVTFLPVPAIGTNYQTRVIFSIQLPTIAVGDLLEAHSSFEVTNNSSTQHVMVGRWMTLAPSSIATTGIDISEAAVRNVSKSSMHHDVVADHASYVATMELTGKYLNLVAYSGAELARYNDVITVEQDYGRMFVTIIDAIAMKK